MIYFTVMKHRITDVGAENFTFYKEPLGSDSDKESIRHAADGTKRQRVSVLETFYS